MKYIFLVLFSVSSVIGYCQIAQTPPMGWNSYNCYGSAVHEDEVKANADYVAKNLKQHGWQYVVVGFYGLMIILPAAQLVTRFNCNYRMALMCHG